MHILIVGDAILDEFIFCEPATSSAGVPILREVSRVECDGGARGVAHVARSLGGPYVWPWQALSCRSQIKTRIRCPGRPEIRIDRPGEMQPRTVQEQHVEHADAVILADYNHGALDRTTRRLLIDQCRQYGVPCVVGAARGVDWQEYDGATIISATQAEAWRANYPHRATDSLYCLTADRQGLRIVRGGESHEACYPAQEVDPLGCGDSVVAALAIGLIEGMSLPDLARFAAAVGAVQAGKGPGIQPVSRAEADSLIFSGCPKSLPA